MSAWTNLKKGEYSSLMKLRVMIRRLQRGFSLFAARGPQDHNQNGFKEELVEVAIIPEDVKEGYFAVSAVMGSETTRFVTKLESLNNPAFLILLEQAKDEYGFQRRGSLQVHCRPEELSTILESYMILLQL